ncbi:hypothetical protein ACM614_29860 [Streptomyces sp. 12297]
MIHLSVDTTSQSYALGGAFGSLLFAAVIGAVVWRATKSYRHVAPGTASVPPAQLPALRARRRIHVIAVLVLITLAAGAKAVAGYHPEPRVAETGATARTDTDGRAGGGSRELVPARTIAPPPQLGRYRLLTGEEAAPYEALAAQKKPAGVGDTSWYYDSSGDGVVEGVLHISTVESNAKLASEKRRDSFTQEFRNFFAGAKARDQTFFDAGPLGGRLGCGHMDTPAGEASVCGWSDAYTMGSVILTDAPSLSEAARTTLAFRTASDQRR